MSSEEEATAANVLSQMSQMQQGACETIEATVINVGHHCDVETSGGQGDHPPGIFQQAIQVALQQETNPAVFQKPDEVHSVASSVQAIIRIPGIGAKIYPCEFCSKVFNKSYNLKTHIRVHTGERPFQCEVCGHGFANLGDLKRHARTHTGEKPFKCDFCSKVFSDFGSHKRHLRLHTGFKPFKCEQCDRDFTRLDSYKNHVRLHTGDRPYKCETCQKEFNYLTTYKRHLNIHKGEKPFSCEQCDKKFTRLNYLKNHMNTHAKLSTQECQTDVSIMVRSESPEDGMDADEQSELEPSEEETAMESLTKDGGESRLEDEANKSFDSSVAAMKGEEEVIALVSSKPGRSKPIDASLLQQVTQVLGDIVPQSITAEVVDGNDGPQIMVHGADQTGCAFKITLAQQLLIAQHILEQAQIQKTAAQNPGSTEESNLAHLTTEISAELADQLVSEAADQQGSRSEQGDTIVVVQTERAVQDVPITTEQRDTIVVVRTERAVQDVPITTDQQTEVVVQSEQEVIAQDQLEITTENSSGIITEHVLDESTTVPIPVTSSGAVFVAIDPTQSEVQQLLGQIHALSQVNPQEEPVSQS